jgi:CHASE1-domain containing sensor protein
MLEKIFANEAFLNLLVSLVSALGLGILGYVGKLVSSRISDQKKADQINNLVADAVWGVYQDFVKSIKASSVDGSLTKDEARAAFIQARDRVIKAAEEKGLPLVEDIGSQGIQRLIENTVQAFKTGNAPWRGGSNK